MRSARYISNKNKTYRIPSVKEIRRDSPGDQVEIQTFKIDKSDMVN
ncbi:hypothetical protein MOMUL_29220 [Moorella mulderi DSM 14980]|uniref:Uncharacterized protein n=1 Tax=Moorella mulderi DSM 14980 TaxID=1122241 RepID=A0A151ASZ7_9FIRM|nr:hypothetical protein MOMUL_29220 [Moorella mulderi DSM 14980]